MTPDRPLSRREFSRAAAALALSPAMLSRLDQIARVRVTWPGYDSALVVDMLASVTPFNVPDMYARPLTAEMVANARASGITAVNATCSSSAPGAEAFVESVGNIAFWE